MIKFWTLFKHDLYNLISSPGTLSVFLIFPTILILLMGFLFDNLYHTTIISSYDFYGVTMIFFIAMKEFENALYLGKKRYERLKNEDSRKAYQKRKYPNLLQPCISRVDLQLKDSHMFFIHGTCLNNQYHYF